MTTCTTCWRICARCVRARGPEGPRLRVPLRVPEGPRRRVPRRWFATSALLALVCVAAVAAQDGSSGWTTYHGDYSGQRHSSLTQITEANVRQLTLAWAFETGQTASIKAS